MKVIVNFKKHVLLCVWVCECVWWGDAEPITWYNKMLASLEASNDIYSVK